MPSNTVQASLADPDPASVPTRRLALRLLSFALEQLQTAEAQLAKEGEARHQGIHQARKCIRRVRATLALGRRKLGHSARVLDDELGRLCRGLSALRDTQALVEELGRLEAMAGPEQLTALSSAKAAARLRRDQMLQRALSRDPQLKSRCRRLQLAQSRLAALDWQALDKKRVLKAMRRSERRAEKSALRVKQSPANAEFGHIYRRRLRRLHQQHTLLAKIEPGLVPPTVGLEARAGALGELQDDRLLLKRCGSHSPFPVEVRPLLRSFARERLRRAPRT